MDFCETFSFIHPEVRINYQMMGKLYSGVVRQPLANVSTCTGLCVFPCPCRLSCVQCRRLDVPGRVQPHLHRSALSGCAAGRDRGPQSRSRRVGRNRANLGQAEPCRDRCLKFDRRSCRRLLALCRGGKFRAILGASRSLQDLTDFVFEV